MLTMYAIPPSLYCAKLRILLRFKGLEWTEIPPPGGYGSAEYRALVPAGSSASGRRKTSRRQASGIVTGETSSAEVAAIVAIVVLEGVRSRGEEAS